MTPIPTRFPESFQTSIQKAFKTLEKAILLNGLALIQLSDKKLIGPFDPKEAITSIYGNTFYAIQKLSYKESKKAGTEAAMQKVKVAKKEKNAAIANGKPAKDLRRALESFVVNAPEPTDLIEFDEGDLPY